MTILVVNRMDDQVLHARAFRVDKRNKYEIYYDILYALRFESVSNGKFSLTRAARQANLPYNRFRETLRMLSDLDLCIPAKNEYLITEKGKEYIEEYHKINDFFKRMGFY